MKKFFVLFLILCMTFAFASCGTKTEQVEEETEEVEEEESFVSNTDWTEYKYTQTDQSGYTIEVTYKLSPWMLLSSNEDKIDNAWREIGDGNTLPKAISDWGLEKNGNYYSRKVSCGGTERTFMSGQTDMYYCVGLLSVKNITEGFDFSDSNPYTAQLWARWMKERFELEGGLYSSVDAIMRVFYTNGASDRGEGGTSVVCNPEMTSNSWGPIPFVIMAPETVNPNNPDGKNKDKIINGYFGKPSEYAVIGVYGKDGEYFEPTYSGN